MLAYSSVRSMEYSYCICSSNTKGLQCLFNDNTGDDEMQTTTIE